MALTWLYTEKWPSAQLSNIILPFYRSVRSWNKWGTLDCIWGEESAVGLLFASLTDGPGLNLGGGWFGSHAWEGKELPTDSSHIALVILTGWRIMIACKKKKKRKRRKQMHLVLGILNKLYMLSVKLFMTVLVLWLLLLNT